MYKYSQKQGRVMLYGVLRAGMNKGQVVKLQEDQSLMSGSQKTAKHLVVKDRRTSLPLATLSG